MEVAGQLQQIGLLIDQDIVITPLEKMAHPLMLPVEVIGVGSVKIVKDGDEVAARGLYQEVIVVRHKSVSMDQNPVPLMDLPQKFQKSGKIPIVGKDVPPFVPSCRDVVNGAFVLDS